jgi:hypothetical protein
MGAGRLRRVPTAPCQGLAGRQVPHAPPVIWAEFWRGRPASRIVRFPGDYDRFPSNSGRVQDEPRTARNDPKATYGR